MGPGADKLQRSWRAGQPWKALLTQADAWGHCSGPEAAGTHCPGFFALVYPSSLDRIVLETACHRTPPSSWSRRGLSSRHPAEKGPPSLRGLGDYV